MLGQDQAWASSQGSDDAVGPRRKFAGGIGKPTRITTGDYRKNTIRLTARMPEATKLVGLKEIDSERRCASRRTREVDVGQD
ncbi:hypothetical protein BHE74_00033044 [Ensete ventricosum]|nr:hypothetical protein BHE74_00033044 [Ensete ventricosum]RZS10068.1 hypothetical protein BHM03_00041228 [Ensete ventricosum]